MIPIALCLLSGILVILSLSPHDHWWMAWFALVPMLVALGQKTVRQAACLGLLTGSIVNYGAFHWLTVVMNDFSNLGLATYLVMAVMALYQGVPFMAWAIFLRSAEKFAGRWGRLSTGFLCAISFPVLEFFYPIVFPWYLANTQHSQINLLGVIELAGAGLLSLAIVSVNLCLARMLLPLAEETGRVWPQPLSSAKRWTLLALAFLTFGSCWLFSVYRNRQMKQYTTQAPSLQLGLVQPNHWIKSVEAFPALHEYQRLTYELVQEAEAAGQPLDLILWPESAVRTPAPPFVSKRGPSDDKDLVRFPLDLVTVRQGLSAPASDLAQERVPREELLSVQRGHDVPILFGATLQDMSPQAVGPLPNGPALYNCGVMLDREGRVAGIAPKVKLLLFGETIPFSGVFPQIYNLLPLASALLPGEDGVVFDHKGARLGMMICYEDLLPWFHFDLAQLKPQILLNLTNDAWFGKTAEAEAHLSLSKLRSIEGRVFLARSTPSGVSAVVDATGAVVGQIEQDRSGTLRLSVALLDIDTGFERFGDSVVWSGLGLWLFYFLLAGLKEAKKS